MIIWTPDALIAEAEGIVQREAIQLSMLFWDACGRHVSAEEVMPSKR